MGSKDNNSNQTNKLDYEKILNEEIINSYENNYRTDVDVIKNKRVYRLKRTLLEIINRLLFFSFVGSFIFSLFQLMQKIKFGSFYI